MQTSRLEGMKDCSHCEVCGAYIPLGDYSDGLCIGPGEILYLCPEHHSEKVKELGWDE